MTKEEIDRFLARVTPEDFDGHTEFHRLTPEERLMWLSQIAQFVVMYKGAAVLPDEMKPESEQSSN
jgi:hypothetical protein